MTFSSDCNSCSLVVTRLTGYDECTSLMFESVIIAGARMEIEVKREIKVKREIEVDRVTNVDRMIKPDEANKVKEANKENKVIKTLG